MNTFKVETTTQTILFSLANLSNIGQSILEELKDTNYAFLDNQEFRVPITTLYRIKPPTNESTTTVSELFDYVFPALGLPPRIQEPLGIDQFGAAGYKNFTITLSYQNKPAKVHGPLLLAADSNMILGSIHPDIYEFAQLLQLDSITDNRVLLSKHRRILAKLNKLKEQGLARLTKFADNKNFIEIEEPLRLELNTDGESVELVPTFDETQINKTLLDNFQQDFKKKAHPTTEILLNEKSSRGHQQYLLINEDLRSELNQIKNINKSFKQNPKILSDLLKNPEAFFDPEKVDLDDFSERVAGLGIFKPIKLPYMATAEVDWWGRIIFTEDDNEENPIPWLDQEKAEVLTNLISEAQSNGLETIQWDGSDVPIDVAIKRIDQFNQYNSTKDTTTEEALPNKLDVLSKQNFDQIEYKIDEAPDTSIQLNFEPLKKSTIFQLKKPYQEQGVAWLQDLWKKQIPGALLADDMGLGKTIQVLYFLEWFVENQSTSIKKPIKILLVSPKSLMHNWSAEYNKFFPNGDHLFYPDTPLSTFLIDAESPYAKVPGMVHQCTYQTLSRNSLPYAKVDWDIIITDEAQYAKTPGTRITNALQSLKSKFKIAMTGTPVENAFQELWNIIDYLYPGFLGPLRTFNKEYNVSSQDTPESLNQKAEALREKIGFLLLRRLKEEVLSHELPPKYLHDTSIDDTESSSIEIPLTKPQVALYQEIFNRAQKGLEKGKALGEIQKLRLISDHPRFITYDQRLQAHSFDNTVIYESARFFALEKILDKVKANNEKALIFADFRSTQYLLKSWLHQRYGIVTHIINGDSPVVETRRQTAYAKQHEHEEILVTRLQITNHFNSKPGFDVLILSPIAAGVGLTITGANHVIHFSRHWNPAKEDQATDRVYRIGQTKEVHVYLPKGIHPDFPTFDVNIAKILARKRSLAKAALYPTNFNDEQDVGTLESMLGAKVI